MVEASPLQERRTTARARRRAERQADGHAVTAHCSMCGADVAVDPSGLCRLGHRLMTSEAAVERHIEAGSPSVDRRHSGHEPAPEEYVSYQDLSVEIDLDDGDRDGGLPPTAPGGGFSIALPSAASQQVPVAIGQVEEFGEPATQAPLREEIEVAVDRLAVEDIAVVQPVGDDYLDDVSRDRLFTRDRTPNDTAPLDQSQILSFDPSGNSGLPVMDPTPAIPQDAGLQIPERLRRPLPDSAEFGAQDLTETTPLDRPAAGADEQLDLTDDRGSVDVSTLIDLEDDSDLGIVDTIPDVSGDVVIDDDLALLEDAVFGTAAVNAEPAEETHGGGTQGGELQSGETQSGETRMFTRREGAGSFDTAAHEGVFVDAHDDEVAGALDPAASSVLDPLQSHDQMQSQDIFLGDAAAEVPLPYPEPTHDLVATFDEPAPDVVRPPTSSWSSDTLRTASDHQRHSLADGDPAEFAEPAPADRMVEPRRTWVDGIAALIFILCLVGVAIYLARTI